MYICVQRWISIRLTVNLTQFNIYCNGKFGYLVHVHMNIGLLLNNARKCIITCMIMLEMSCLLLMVKYHYTLRCQWHYHIEIEWIYGLDILFSCMRLFKLYFNHSNIGNASKMFCDIFEMQCRIFSLTYTIQKIYAFTCTLHVRLIFFYSWWLYAIN